MIQNSILIAEETNRSCEECYYHGKVGGRLWCTLSDKWVDDTEAERCIDFEPFSEHREALHE